MNFIKSLFIFLMAATNPQKSEVLDVHISGQICSYNREILRQKSQFINYLFNKPFPPERIEFGLPYIDSYEIKEYLDGLCKPSIKALHTFIIANSLMVSPEEIGPLKERAKLYISSIWIPFVQKYQFPFTELTMELNYLFKVMNEHWCVRRVFADVNEEMDYEKKREYAAAYLHGYMLSHEYMNDRNQFQSAGSTDVEWMIITIMKNDLPSEFLHRLNLNHYQDYIIENPPGQIYDPWTSKDVKLPFHISRKYQGQEIIPLDYFDRKYLKWLKRSRELKMTIG